MLIPQSIDHLVFRIANLATTEHFYTELLGQPTHRTKDSRMYMVGNTAASSWTHMASKNLSGSMIPMVFASTSTFARTKRLYALSSRIRTNFKDGTFHLLQIRNHLQQIARLRIPLRT